MRPLLGFFCFLLLSGFIAFLIVAGSTLVGFKRAFSSSAGSSAGGGITILSHIALNSVCSVITYVSEQDNHYRSSHVFLRRVSRASLWDQMKWYMSPIIP